METTLAIGDIHAPFDHPNYLRFLQETADRFGVTKVVMIGDAVDQYALSTFGKDVRSNNSFDEWQDAKKSMARYNEAFPEVEWVIGNHDRRVSKRASEGNIPSEWIRDLPEIYGVPNWTLSTCVEIDGVDYIHGEGAGGISSWQNYAVRRQKSVVIGHMHSVHGVRYHKTPGGQIFTGATGCGINLETYAFHYAKDYANPPALGCIVVENGIQALPIVMDMSDRRNYRIRRKV